MTLFEGDYSLPAPKTQPGGCKEPSQVLGEMGETTRTSKKQGAKKAIE